MSAQPPLVFIIYAREDEPFRAELKAQLLPMERAGVLRVWTDRELIAGEHWEPEIKKNLKNADIILVLVSSDYFQSDYIHEVELREAIERHDRGEARVVPVIVRPCVWDTDPVVSRTQVLPTDGVPVNDTRHWHSREAAWVDVVQGVRRTLAQLLQERAAAETARSAAEEAEATRRAAEEQRARETEAARLREQQANEAEAQRQQAEANLARKEAFDWNLAQQTATTEAFYAYLNAYPTGAYAREARKRLRQTQGSNNSGSSPTLRYAAIAVAALALAVVAYFLCPEPPTPPAGTSQSEPSSAETADWAAAQRANTIPAYRDFLNKHRSGPHATEAETARKALEQRFNDQLRDALRLLRDPDMLPESTLPLLDTALLLWPGHADALDTRKMIGDGMWKEAKQTLERVLAERE